MPGFGVPPMPQFMMQPQEADDESGSDSSDSQDAKITTSATMLKGLPRVWLSQVVEKVEPMLDSTYTCNLDLVQGQALCQDLRASCLADDWHTCCCSCENHLLLTIELVFAPTLIGHYQPRCALLQEVGEKAAAGLLSGEAGHGRGELQEERLGEAATFPDRRHRALDRDESCRAMLMGHITKRKASALAVALSSDTAQALVLRWTQWRLLVIWWRRLLVLRWRLLVLRWRPGPSVAAPGPLVAAPGPGSDFSDPESGPARQSLRRVLCSG